MPNDFDTDDRCEVTWVPDRKVFMAYSNEFPGLFHTDAGSAYRARRKINERIRELLIANDFHEPLVDPSL